ncbi:MAG: smalltalk protein [Bacteroidaceae bacterium]|nr:smalltalk protein [Bacteroidaceae bacterium]
MKRKTIIEMAVKVIVAALTAFLTALGTTSCMSMLQPHKPTGLYISSSRYSPALTGTPSTFEEELPGVSPIPLTFHIAAA